MRHVHGLLAGVFVIAACGASAQGTDATSTESPVQPSSQGATRSSGPGLGNAAGTNPTGASGSSATITPDGNRELGTTVRGGRDSASTSDRATSRTWSGVGSTGGATGTGTSSGTSDAPSEAAAGVTPPQQGNQPR